MSVSPPRQAICNGVMPSVPTKCRLSIRVSTCETPISFKQLLYNSLLKLHSGSHARFWCVRYLTASN